jgi:cytochrome c oxidase subunit 1
MRAPGMTWFRLPLFVWAHYATSLIMVLGSRSSRSVLLLAFERSLRVDLDPRSAATRCCSSTCSGSTRTRPFTSWCCPAGRDVGAGLGRAQERVRLQLRRLLEPGDRDHRLPWCGATMFVAGQTPYAGLVFSIITYLVGVPPPSRRSTGRDPLQGLDLYDTPTLYAFGFLGCSSWAA